mmetsp:Transcript_6314/g.15739  ORF Transcript_6314/g.15739 Transcript_6314/m.15739 type:complete len:120 (+) Transcript_6314:127-486(+)
MRARRWAEGQSQGLEPVAASMPASDATEKNITLSTVLVLCARGMRIHRRSKYSAVEDMEAKLAAMAAALVVVAALAVAMVVAVVAARDMKIIDGRGHLRDNTPSDKRVDRMKGSQCSER